MNATLDTTPPDVGGGRRDAWTADILPTLTLGVENLLVHKLRSLLTMLGMIFGVAAVVSMLSIGAGAQQQVMAFIEDLGVRNLIVESREAPDEQAFQKIRKISPGLTFQDLRTIRANIPGIEASTARKRFLPGKLIPKPVGDMPTVYGIEPSYQRISGIRIAEGRFLTPDDEARAAPVAVLGEGVRGSLFGGKSAIGEYVKVNEQWLRVVGVAGPQLSAQTDMSGVPAEDRNSIIYTPLSTAVLRLEDAQSYRRDEVDGLYLQLATADQTVPTSRIVRGLLNDSHKEAGDFTIVVPAELLAQQRRTQRIFEMVMVAIASISLLVGGIGIMNIMLASILERTREIGIRRAVGAKRRTIIRQFLLEATLISCAGGLIGVMVGAGLSRVIGFLAGWTTIVSLTSIVLAFSVSVAIGLVFGVYPAKKAASLDPVEALHYE
jgi:putative ABC transport system permease protein